MDEDERLWKLYEHAEKQISRVWKAYAVLGTLLAILIGVGTFFTYDSVSAFRNEMREQVTADTKLVQEQVRAQIDLEFGRDNIQALIATQAQERIDAVADRLIKEQIEQQVSPRMISLTMEIDSYEQRMMAAEYMLEDFEAARRTLDAEIEMASLVFSAMADSRSAYDSLREIAGTPDHLRSELAARTVRQVERAHEWKGWYSSDEWPADAGRSLSFLLTALSDPDPLIRKAALDTLWRDGDASAIQGIMNLLEVETELTVCAAATRALSELTQQESAALDIEFWLSWWEENQG